MFKDMTLGQYYPVDSWLHRLDPRIKLLNTMVYLASLFLAKNALGYIIAALYLDSGMNEARRFIMEHVLKDAELDDAHRIADYKTRFQELVQKKSNQIIAYQLVDETGPGHDKTFTFEVSINGEVYGRGDGGGCEKQHRTGSRLPPPRRKAATGVLWGELHRHPRGGAGGASDCGKGGP